ncbi:MAG: hypothetical protein HYZ42_10055 [Bacteroidetes bacterium]|nr:hypothetical protein [Bacteroidota bacterium]
MSIPLISNFFIIFILQLLFSLYKSEYSNIEIFNAAIILGIGFLLQVEFIFLLVLFLISIANLKVINIRDVFITLIGFFLPFYVYYSIAFLNNSNEAIGEELFNNFTKNISFETIFTQPARYISFVLALIIFLLGCFKLSRNYMKNMLKIRKFQAIILILLPISLVMAAVGYQSLDDNLLFCAIPLSIFISYYTMGNEWGWWKELLLDMVIGLVVYNQWQTHLQ